MSKIHRFFPLLLLAVTFPLLSSCQALQQVAALRHVDFDLDRVSDMQLAGVSVGSIRSYNDLSLVEVGRLTAAFAQRKLPVSFNLHVNATNPPENRVSARMVGLAWTLLIEDRETISGTVNQLIDLPPGQPQDIPVSIGLDLVQFFDRNLRDLVELALAVSGQGGAPKNIQLRATPTIETPLGPIRYPQPITIVSREVGG
jgi:hypothetical protein